MLFPKRLSFSRRVSGRSLNHARRNRGRNRRKCAYLPGPTCCGPTVEQLEGRQMLSAAASATVFVARPTYMLAPGHTTPTTTPTVQPDTAAAPYDPVQMETAYGVNDISFNGVAGNGAGQTIAIVDAYNDPFIVQDAGTFSSQFGLPQFNVAGGPTLQVLGETGASTLPVVDGQGWDLEESLDVEWIHSMAPEANIILFEANSDDSGDMYQAETTAADFPGVSVVSNSWISPEYSGETQEDGVFSTPSGHQGVTFLAGSGDNGTPSGYPASSPNVVAVGGTTLQIQSNGTYVSESAWSDSGGGISEYESLPGYQGDLDGINGASKTNRNVPDVAADADPNTGVEVLDSFSGGWFQVGGTSLACPLWAGIIGIVNQGRALAGEGTLNGATQTLPMLYNLPASDFHDITTGGNGTYNAGPGYDLVTGLGTPVANLLVPAMAGYTENPPNINAPSSEGLSEDSSLTFSSAHGDGITVTDAFSAGQPDRFTISVQHGTVTLGTTAGITFVSGSNGSSSFSFTGTLANLNAALSGLVYQPTSYYTGTDTLSLEDSNAFRSGSASVALTIKPVTPRPAPPSSPQISAPSSTTLNQNSSVAFTGSDAISITDPSGTAEKLTLSVSHGTLHLGTTTGLTVTGNGTDSVVLTGALSSLNSDLASLTYTPSSGYFGDDTLSLTDEDTSDDLTATASVSIVIRPFAPSITAPTAVSATQNSIFAFTGADAISVTDPSATSEQMTLAVSHGALSLGTTGGLTVSGNGTATVTLTGPLSSLNSDLSSLIYTPTSGYHGSDTLSLSDEDTADDLSATGSVAITIGALAPGITAPSAVSINDNSSLAFTGSNTISVTDSSGTAEQMTLTVSEGTLILGSSTGLSVVGSDTASLTLTGSLANLNSGLATLSYTPTTDYSGPDTLSLSDQDTTDGLKAAASVAITVNSVAPTITAPKTVSLSENASVSFTGANEISVTDPSGTAEQLTLTVSHGTLELSTPTGLTVTGNGTATVTLAGSLSNLNADLPSLTYTPTSSYNGSDTLNLTDKNTADNLTATASVLITVVPFSPSITAPAGVSVAQNSSVTFTDGSAISVTDLGGTAEQLTLSVNEGTLGLGTTTGLTVTGNGTALMSLTGSLSSLDSDLASLTYTPTAGYSGRDTLSLSDKDTGDSLTATASVPITISPLAPSITAPSSVSVNEDGSLTFSGGNAITVSDPSGASEQLTLTVDRGTLSLGTTTGLTVTGSGTTSMILTGSLSSLNSDLTSLTDAPTSGYIGTDTLTLSVEDISDDLQGSAIVSITVNAVGPVITAPSAVLVAENGSLAFTGGNAISVSDINGTAEQMTLAVSHGTLNLGTTTGLAVTGNGTGTVTLTGALSSLNSDLASLSYTPTSGYGGSDTLSLSDEDTATSQSGSFSVALTIDSLTPTITAPASATINENGWQVFSTANGNAISVGDANGGGDSLALSVAHGTLTLASVTGLTFTSGANGAASFAVTGTPSNLNAALNGLVYQPAANYSGSDSLSASLTNVADNGSTSTSVPLTIGDFLAISGLSAASTNENTPLTLSSANANAISITDTAGNLESLTLSVAHGTLTLGGTAGLTVTSGANGSSEFTVSGTNANLNAALNGLTYQPNSFYSGSDTLAASATDEGNGFNVLFNMALTVVDTEPIITVPGVAGSVIENGSLVYSSANGDSIFVTDNYAGTNLDSLTLSVGDGTLTLATTNGLILTSGSNDSASLTAKGTVANLNAALNGLTYRPNTNYAGSDTMNLSVLDPTVSKEGVATLGITVNALPPAVAAPATASLNENGSLAFSSANGNAISLTDANTGGSDSLALSVAHGTLTLSTTSGLTFTAGSNASASFTVTGPLANLNAALNGLTYQPVAIYSGSDSISISISDPKDNESGSAAISLTINPLAAPSIAAPASASVTGSLVFSSSNGNAITLTDAAAGANSDSLTLSVTHGTLTLATTSGLAFTSGSNASASFTVTGTLANLNAALAGLTYRPTTGYSGSDSLAISVADPGDQESASTSVALTVTSSSPPSISAPTAGPVTADSSLTFSSANGNAITVADSGPGSGADSLTLTVTHGTVTLSTTSGLTITSGGNGTATITVTGSVANLNAALSGLTYTPTSGYTGSDSLAISISDAADSLSASKSVSLTISPGPPSITAPATVAVKTTTIVFESSLAITVSDFSAGTQVEELLIKANSGTFKLATTSGITFVSGANGTGSMTIEGTLSSFNAALNGLTYTFSAKSATIVLQYTDLGTGQNASASIAVSEGGSVSSGAVVAGGSATPDTAPDAESSMPPDALTQWQGFAAAVESLSG